MKHVFILLASIFFTNYSLAQDRPNFIIILADDLGYGDLGVTGSSVINTPNIDRLADEGVFFQQGYVSSPVCSPSRAGLLIGKNQVSFGHDNNIDQNQPGFDPHYLGMPLTEKTIAERLKEQGYVTGLIGKWHLGEAPHFHPTQRGFDEFWGFTNGGHDYFEAKPGDSGYKRPIETNFEAKTNITYLTNDIGRECINFIQRHHQKPFFLLASFNAPHTPMQALDEDLEHYAHIKNQKKRTYAAMVHRLDVIVGNIMIAIKSSGLMDNTMVVFLSDNGGPVINNGSLNAPYYGQKGTLYEGGIHVPFFIRWPEKIKSGSVYHHPITTLDLAPTFFALAGGNVVAEEFSGVNLMPYLSQEKKERPHQRLFWRFTIGAAIRDGDKKLIRLPDRYPMYFDLSKDISEQNDLALKKVEDAKLLLRILGDWDINQPHPLFLEGANWKPYNQKRYDMDYVIKQ